jgi:hypothetical protein
VTAEADAVPVEEEISVDDAAIEEGVWVDDASTVDTTFSCTYRLEVAVADVWTKDCAGAEDDDAGEADEDAFVLVG